MNVCDWTPYILDLGDDVNIPQKAIDFEIAYEELYGMESSQQSCWGYDCVYLFKAACEAAGTTEDREAINEGMKSIDMQGVNNYYRYDTTHTIFFPVIP